MSSFSFQSGNSVYSKIREYYDSYMSNEEDKYGEAFDLNKFKENIKKLENNKSDAVAIKEQLQLEIECELYTKQWSLWVNTKNASNVKGIIKRRYIEWMLFQYGYLYTSNSYYSGVEANEIQRKIVEIAKNSKDYGIVPINMKCLGWVYDVYEAAGAGRGWADCACCGGYQYGVSKDFANVPIGAAVYGEGSTKWGHVGIYLGDGLVADDIDSDGDGDGDVRITTLDKWRKKYPNGCWGWASPNPVNSAYPITKGLMHKCE